MKTIIKFLIGVFIFLVFSGFNYTHGANYTNIASSNNYHRHLGEVLGRAAEEYFEQNPGPISDSQLEEIRQGVNDIIVSEGGWNGVSLTPSDPRWNRLARIESNQLIVGCGNEDLIVIDLQTHPVAPVSPAPVSLAPPPEPVVTSSTSRSSCSYISSFSPSWSNCNISSNWDTNGNIECKQTKTWIANRRTASWSCTTTYIDGVARGTTCNGSCPSNASRPSNQTKTITISSDLNFPNSECNGTTYANNSDTCKIKVSVSGNTEQNKAITGWGTKGDVTNISDTSDEKSDRINKTGEALNFSSISSDGISDSTTNNFDLIFDGIKSRSPFQSNNGSISFKIGGVDLELKNINYNFKKPFTGEIKTYDDINDDWEGATILGTQMKYKLITNNQTSTLNLDDILEYFINDFSNDILPNGTGLEVQAVSLSGSTRTDKSGTLFTARLNTSSGATTLNETSGIKIDLPIISYKLGGQDIKYYLSEEDEGDDETPIVSSYEEFKGVKIVGILQGDGKQEITGQLANFSNKSTSETRGIIRKNAYKYIKNLNSGDILNGVKYVEGDINITGEQDYETLIVKDGNVIIEGDLNVSRDKLGIIVLKDGYNVDTDYINKGNVYVKSNVEKINAIIYADGGLISTDIDGDVYTTDSIERTKALKSQLIINGTLFTRNTIGGSILAGGYYELPGGNKINDFNKAMIYDLNYIRRGNKGCDTNGNSTCNDPGEYLDPFVIIYDSKIQIDPPKLFSY